MLGKSYRVWQFEARQLETVFPGCHPHHENSAQLWLPLPDVVAQTKILLP
jgi:hypothetical protein